MLRLLALLFIGLSAAVFTGILDVAEAQVYIEQIKTFFFNIKSISSVIGSFL